MKKFIFFLLPLLSAVLLITSCKKDKGDTENTQPPTLTSATVPTNRGTSITQIGYGEWIMLRGTNLKTTFKVDFNGVLASDSLIYADDSTVTVKIPATLPDPLNNPITVTTKYGSATLNFKILQPAPTITSFDPMTGAAGDEVTIKGNYFKGVTGVTFDATPATIVSSTQNEIKVKVPTGITTAYIYVTTPVGTAKSDKIYGFKMVIFDDALQNAWTNTSYSATYDMNYTAIVRRGTKSQAHKFTVGFGAARYSHASMSTTGYTGLKISIYGGPGTAGKKVRITIVSGFTFDLILTEGSWSDFQVPFSSLGNPATMASITFQEFSGLASQIYIDDVGLY